MEPLTLNIRCPWIGYLDFLVRMNFGYFFKQDNRGNFDERENKNVFTANKWARILVGLIKEFKAQIKNKEVALLEPDFIFSFFDSKTGEVNERITITIRPITRGEMMQIRRFSNITKKVKEKEHVLEIGVPLIFSKKIYVKRNS